MVGDIWRASVFYRYGDQVAVNTWHFAITAQTGPALTTGALALHLKDNVLAAVLPPLVATPAEIDGLTDHQVNPPGIENPGEVVWGIPGTGGAGVAPMQTAALIKWHTGFGGRRGRGRTYLPFVPQTQITGDSRVIPAYQVLMANLALALNTPFVVQDGLGNSWSFSLVVYSRIDRLGRLVKDHFAEEGLATQRRRSILNRGDRSPFS